MEGSYPNRQLRIDCDLSPVDFELARKSIINRLKSSLPNYLDYHSINHPLSVEKAAERIASLEGIKGEDLILLRTAVLYHDSGFIVQYEDNEKYGIQLAKNELPKFGYNKEQIQIICDIIMATRNGANPNSLLQQIMCDADHDYLGRADYYTIAKSLRREMANYGKIMSETEWLNFQIHYLENVHCYYTQTSKNIRGKGKQKRIGELKAKKNRL